MAYSVLLEDLEDPNVDEYYNLVAEEINRNEVTVRYNWDFYTRGRTHGRNPSESAHCLTVTDGVSFTEILAYAFGRAFFVNLHHLPPSRTMAEIHDKEDGAGPDLVDVRFRVFSGLLDRAADRATKRFVDLRSLSIADTPDPESLFAMRGDQ